MFQLLQKLQIKPSHFLISVHEKIKNNKALFEDLYKNYQVDELKNQWNSESEIQEFFSRENVYESYVDGEFGSNEIYAYRAMFIFQHMKEVHDLAFDTARELIRTNGVEANAYQEYLDHLQDFSLKRKIDMLDTSSEEKAIYNFDFVKLTRENFMLDPLDVFDSKGFSVFFRHNRWQKDTVKGYLAQYGDSVNGLGRILLRSHVKRLYREVSGKGQINSKKELVEEVLQLN